MKSNYDYHKETVYKYPSLFRAKETGAIALVNDQPEGMDFSDDSLVGMVIVEGDKLYKLGEFISFSVTDDDHDWEYLNPGSQVTLIQD